MGLVIFKFFGYYLRTPLQNLNLYESRHAFDALVDIITDVQSTTPTVYNLRELQTDVPGFFSTRVILGFYFNHLKDWLRYFNSHQIFVLDGDSLVENPWVEMRKLQKFLNLEIDIGKKNFYRNKKTGRGFCFESFECSKENKNVFLDEAISTVSRNKLERLYRVPNEELVRFTGKRFFWGDFRSML